MTTVAVSPPVGLSIYTQTRGAMQAFLGHGQQMQTALAANSILSSLAQNLLNDTVNIINFAAQVESDPALEASVLALWAADQPTATTSAQMGTLLGVMFTATTNLNSALQADMPKDSDGNLLIYTFGTNGALIPIAFVASQFPNTATALTAWLATVS
jgi:hypothetical protein